MYKSFISFTLLVAVEIFLLKYTHILLCLLVIIILWSKRKNLDETLRQFSPFNNFLVNLFVLNKRDALIMQEIYIAGAVLLGVCLFFFDQMTKSLDNFEKRQAYIIGYREHPSRRTDRGTCGNYYIKLQNTNGETEIFLTNIEMSGHLIDNNVLTVYINHQDTPFVILCKWVPIVEYIHSDSISAISISWRTVKITIIYWCLFSLSFCMIGIYIFYKLRLAIVEYKENQANMLR